MSHTYLTNIPSRWHHHQCTLRNSQELVLYQKLVAGYQPDIVICAFFVENDLADNSYRMSSSNRIYLDLDEEDNLYQRPFSAQRAVASQWLNRYSRFYLWQKRAQRNIAEMIRHNSGRVRTRNWVHCTQETEDLSHAWKLTGNIHEQLCRRTETETFNFIFELLGQCINLFQFLRQ